MAKYVNEAEKQEFINNVKGKHMREIRQIYPEMDINNILRRIRVWKINHKKRQKNKLNNFNINDIKKFAKNHTSKEIAQHYGVKPRQARDFLNRKNITFKPSEPKYSIGKILKLREKGYLLTEIEKELGVSSSHAAYICRQYKLNTPKLSSEKILHKHDKYCKSIGYKSAYDYINKHGAQNYRIKIKPKVV